jgi:hypothetical protein
LLKAFHKTFHKDELGYNLPMPDFRFFLKGAPRVEVGDTALETDRIGYVDYLLEEYDAGEVAYRESLANSLSLGDRHNQGRALQDVEIFILCRDHPAFAANAKKIIEQMFGKIGDEITSAAFEAILQHARWRLLAEVVSDLLS